MKSHYCPEEKGEVHYEGQCNWCGEKEMNALELADRIETSPYAEYKSAKDAANMLRQLAKEKAELEKENELLTAKLNYMFEQELKTARVK
jgi:predicted DCC family thiol-disulfide oxidoreductase YuxK